LIAEQQTRVISFAYISACWYGAFPLRSRLTGVRFPRRGVGSKELHLFL